MLFCAAVDASSSTRLSEGDDAESSESASVEGQGKAATSINWMHVRCRSLYVFSTWPEADDARWSHQLRRISSCKECGIYWVWRRRAAWSEPHGTVCTLDMRIQQRRQNAQQFHLSGPTLAFTCVPVTEGLTGRCSCVCGPEQNTSSTDALCCMQAALREHDLILTVSPGYALEICSDAAMGCGMQDVLNRRGVR